MDDRPRREIIDPAGKRLALQLVERHGAQELDSGRDRELRPEEGLWQAREVLTALDDFAARSGRRRTVTI